MNKVSIVFIIVVVFTVSACGGGKTEEPINIIGKWQIKSIEGEKLDENQKKTIFQFKVVGNDIQKYNITQGKAKQEGKWLLSGKTLQLIPKKGSAQLLKNLKLKSNILSFENEGKKISLKKK